MATEAQLAANRRNAKKSTGPKTPAGKAASRMNALKTGIHAESHVIRGEDPAALAQLAAEYNEEFRPATPRERDLVDTLVHNEWSVRRLRAIEAGLWEHQFGFNDDFYDADDEDDRLDRSHPLAVAYRDLEQRLDRLQRRVHAFERSTVRALQQLRALQADVRQASSPANDLQVAQPVDQPARSPKTGFVPSNPPRPADPPQTVTSNECGIFIKI